MRTALFSIEARTTAPRPTAADAGRSGGRAETEMPCRRAEQAADNRTAPGGPSRLATSGKKGIEDGVGRTESDAQAPAPGMVIQLHKGNVDYGTPWELEHE